MIRTLVIRRGRKHEIRAIAWPGSDGGRDTCPTLQFFQEQSERDPGEFATLCALLDDTAKEGPPPIPGKFKALATTGGLFEFKTNGGLRLICFWDEGSLIICTHGFLKKQQKTPGTELKRA